ncbi:TraR/DksA family transcriptional regulator [Ideonella sp. BN130291]|uniref:TraR/DksA family transcriptional regulator n=1 Tax=Ideonella sp. BN130291 TaxID=3112940 RepID=UPI002E26C36F|nr:TraR/DksA family transcriptional regulator [Ideonella sp. BN130291]
MPALTDSDLQRLQQQLREREATLRAEVKAAREEEAERPSAVARNQNEDLGEQGEENIRGAVRYAEQERDIQELRDIEEATERITAGTYGECVDCGADIPLQRLQAQPSAKRCIACQETFERTHPALPRFPSSL